MEIKIFTDMDGVMAVYDNDFNSVDSRKKGYFRNRPVDEKMVDFINLLVENGYDVSICSSLCPGRYVKNDKNTWLNEKGVNVRERVFVPVGQKKGEYVNLNNGSVNILLDDYSVNLHTWEENGGVGLKYYNGLNGHNGTWNGASIDKDMSLDDMLEVLASLIEKRKHDTDRDKENI